MLPCLRVLSPLIGQRRRPEASNEHEGRNEASGRGRVRDDEEADNKRRLRVGRLWGAAVWSGC